MGPARIALATGLLLLASPTRAACPDPQDLLDFERAVHRQLACELADRLLGEEGCTQSAVPECAVPALAQLEDLLPGGFADRLLASWGYSGASCRLALARASELSLHELLTQPLKEAAGAPAHPHASRGGRPGHSGHPSDVEEDTEAGQAMSEMEQVCDGVEVGLRAIVGGSCAMLGQWGDILDGPRLRGCVSQALGRMAEEVRPGASPPSGRPEPERPGGAGQGDRPGGRP